jgi:hypothetical protein
MADEGVDVVVVVSEFHLDLEVGQDGREVGLADRELELAAGLEDLVALGRLADLGLDVEQAVADLDVGVVGPGRQEVGLDRHPAGLEQHRLAVPHLAFHQFDDAGFERPELGAGHDPGGIFGRGRDIFCEYVSHFCYPRAVEVGAA